MKQLIKAGLLFGLVFFMAESAWALPIVAGDTVIMTVDGDAEYTMTKETSTYDWDHYYSFCLESEIFFTPGTIYKVDSVADYATGGGMDYSDWFYNKDYKDYLSDQTKWAFASYFTNSSAYDASMVQNAIWWLEDEAKGDKKDWGKFFKAVTGEKFKKNKKYDYTSILADWDIQAVNLIYYDTDGNAVDVQSQLVGTKGTNNNPVPEPATMVLFGIGLLSMAGAGRKKIKR